MTSSSSSKASSPAAAPRAGSTRISDAWARLANDQLQRSSLALAANSAVTSVLGFAYWIAAARFYDPAVVGETAALISAVQLLATVAELNLNNTLIRFLPTAGTRSVRYVARAYLTVVLMSTAVGLLALPLIRGLSLVDYLVQFGPLGIAIVMISVPLWSLFALQDGAAIGARAAGWVLTENTVFGVVKLILLVAFASTLARLGIFTSWLLAMLLVVAMMTVVLFRRLLPRHGAEPGAAVEHVSRRDVTAFITIDNLTLIVMTAGIHLLPALVVSRSDNAAAGYFFAAWAIHGAFDLALINVANSLTVEGARQQDQLGRLVVTMVRRMAIVAVPVVAVVILLAPAILSLYGTDYAVEGVDVLRLAALALLPRAVAVVWMSVNRVRRRLGRILVLQLFLTTTVLGLSWIMVPAHGIVAVGIAYLAAQTVGAAVLVPSLLRLVRGVRVSRDAADPTSP